MKTPPIFVISLARAADRRADIVRRLEADGLRYEIVDAVDGQQINRADYADRLEQYHRKEGSCFRCIYQKKRAGQPLSMGEIGCYLSHYNLWQRIAGEEIPMAIILEDDAVWNADFAAVVSAAAATEWQWDLIKLFGSGGKKVHRTLQQLHSCKLVQFTGQTWCTAAYMISLSGAKKLLRHCYYMHSGIDEVWRDDWNWGGYAYNIQPYPVGVADVPSEIGKEGRKVSEEKRKIPFRIKVQRLFRVKFHHWIMKRLYRWFRRPKKK